MYSDEWNLRMYGPDRFSSVSSALARSSGDVLVRIEAEIVQRRRDHVGRRIEHMDAAIGELGETSPA